MIRPRHSLMLMAALGAALSAGGTAAPADTGKVKLIHVDTKQECDFDDQAAADDFLAQVESPASWAQEAKAKHVNVELTELHAQLAADKAADAAAAAPAAADAAEATTPPADPAPAPAPEAAPAPAAPTTRARKPRAS